MLQEEPNTRAKSCRQARRRFAWGSFRIMRRDQAIAAIAKKPMTRVQILATGSTIAPCRSFPAGACWLWSEESNRTPPCGRFRRGARDTTHLCFLENLRAQGCQQLIALQCKTLFDRSRERAGHPDTPRARSIQTANQPTNCASSAIHRDEPVAHRVRW